MIPLRNTLQVNDYLKLNKKYIFIIKKDFHII